MILSSSIALHAADLLRVIGESIWAPSIIFALAFALDRVLAIFRIRWNWAWLSLGLTGLLLITAAAYVVVPVLFEDAETDIACISALAMRSQPLFPGPSEPQRYILLYGPLTYLAHVPFYWILGTNLLAFKLLGFTAFLVSMVGIYRICREYASTRASLIGLGAANLVFFRYIGVEFWGRIDPLILAAVVVSIWATLEAPLTFAVVVNAIAFAAIPNLKASGVAYLLPVAGLLLFRRGWKPAFLAVGLSLLLFPLPFLLPGVSLPNYIGILRVAAAHGLVPEFLLRNIQYSALLLAPVAAIFLSAWRGVSFAQKCYFALIVLGLISTSFLGAKSGAGSYHLIPFVAPLVHLYIWRRSEIPPADADRPFARFAVAWVLTTLALSDHHLRTVLREFRFGPSSFPVIEEIGRFERSYPGKTLAVGIGVTFDDPRTRYAYVPVFHGQPYTISGAAIRDLQFGNIPIPVETVRYFEACGTAIWLIPKGQEPFSAGNSYYDRFHPAFEEEFRQAFRANYKLTESGKQFDVWTCAR